MIRAFDIELKQIDYDMKRKSKVHKIDDRNKPPPDVTTILKEFAPIFEEKIGCVPNIQISLKLRDDVKPDFTKERDVPYALRERVEKELESLEKEGIIEVRTEVRSQNALLPKTLPKCTGYCQ